MLEIHRPIFFNQSLVRFWSGLTLRGRNISFTNEDERRVIPSHNRSQKMGRGRFQFLEAASSAAFLLSKCVCFNSAAQPEQPHNSPRHHHTTIVELFRPWCIAISRLSHRSCFSFCCLISPMGEWAWGWVRVISKLSTRVKMSCGKPSSSQRGVLL